MGKIKRWFPRNISIKRPLLDDEKSRRQLEDIIKRAVKDRERSREHLVIQLAKEKKELPLIS